MSLRELNRRSFLQLSGMTLLQACSLNERKGSVEREKLRLFDHGQWYATVCYDSQASAQVQAAVAVLTQYCQRSTGVVVDVAEQQPSNDRLRIYVATSKE